eukprot:GHVT01064491.1.p1 GENE.GHVT01064491.1~~GHVT01064491.1.p1  ORF type:complete len:269 (-),score=32.75 GHVT01064491.1:858-1664(-)
MPWTWRTGVLDSTLQPWTAAAPPLQPATHEQRHCNQLEKPLYPPTATDISFDTDYPTDAAPTISTPATCSPTGKDLEVELPGATHTLSTTKLVGSPNPACALPLHVEGKPRMPFTANDPLMGCSCCPCSKSAAESAAAGRSVSCSDDESCRLSTSETPVFSTGYCCVSTSSPQQCSFCATSTALPELFYVVELCAPLRGWSFALEELKAPIPFYAALIPYVPFGVAPVAVAIVAAVTAALPLALASTALIFRWQLPTKLYRWAALGPQ